MLLSSGIENLDYLLANLLVLAEKYLKGRAQLQRTVVVFGCGPIIGKYLCLFDKAVAILFRCRRSGIKLPAQA
jgi:hypothetical protein